jgi:hypothetical protein
MTITTNPSTMSGTLTVAAVGKAAALTAATAVPVAPPDEWFTLPDHGDPYDVVIEDDGRVHGYPAATWDACHLSFPDECVNPPRSNSDYAYFKVGSVRTASGARVRTGPLTLRGGHADRTLSASRAMAFYDDTNSAFADVNIGENEHGMWIAGALRPEISPEQVRAAMGSGFSGDWRGFGEDLELIALSAVNTPGFRHNVAKYADALAASVIIDLPNAHAIAEVAECDPEHDAILASAVQRIAQTIGRSTDQRIAALRARVHQEVSDGG